MTFVLREFFQSAGMKHPTEVSSSRTGYSSKPAGSRAFSVGKGEACW
jgi:hypothetical protein